MLVNALVTFLVSFISGVLCIVFMGKLAKRFKVLSGQQVPVVGGSAIWISFCLACAYSLVLHRTFSIEIAGILCASFLMLIFGIIDDWKELSIASKFFFQIIATAVLIVLGVKTQIVYIGIFMNVVVTLLWVIGITNAFNHIDIMDGLAAGVALIVSISFAAVALFNHDYQIFLLAIALSGSIAGFLVFNLAPAKIYMGNAGSHFLGFILSAVALTVHYAPVERPIALLSPLLLLGFLIFDTTFLVAMRLQKKKLPFMKSNDHLALRLLSLGYTKQKTLLVLLAVCLFFVSCGVLLTLVSTLVASVMIATVVLISAFLMLEMSKIKVHG